jgi:hypothetical protein
MCPLTLILSPRRVEREIIFMGGRDQNPVMNDMKIIKTAVRQRRIRETIPCVKRIAFQVGNAKVKSLCIAVSDIFTLQVPFSLARKRQYPLILFLFLIAAQYLIMAKSGKKGNQW